eukprot:6768703-Prymnesium_polylepis.2
MNLRTRVCPRVPHSLASPLTRNVPVKWKRCPANWADLCFSGKRTVWTWRVLAWSDWCSSSESHSTGVPGVPGVHAAHSCLYAAWTRMNSLALHMPLSGWEERTFLR